MKKGFTLIFFFSLLFSSVQAQYENLDTLGFLSPVTHPLQLTGNFGELRSNHFHSGLDIRSSNGQTGDPIIAVEDGWVSRVKVQLTGYGHALYIDHPNGYTSVYAHLVRFSPELEKYLNRKQNILESYTVDLYLDQEQLQVSKGDTIAFMGNTGRSTGPHLHFEIRETKTEEPINPFHFGIKNLDTRKPVIRSVKFYGLDKNLVQINQKTINVSKQKKATVTIDAWRTGIGVLAHDFIDGSWNKNGIYAFQVFVDDSLYFENKFDQFAFHQTRYLNASIDYPTKVNQGSKYLLAYRKPGNSLDMYNKNNGNGVIKLYKDQPRNLRYVAIDFDGNQSEVNFILKRKAEISELKPRSYNYYVQHEEAQHFKIGKLDVQLPAGSLYQDAFFNLSYESSDQFPKFNIAEKDQACHLYYEIKLDVSQMPDSLKQKLYIAYLSGSGNSIGGTIVGDTLTAKTNRFGSFKLAIDETPPSLTILSKLTGLEPGDRIKVKLSDNVGVLGYAQEVNWNVYIDGRWILAPYDLKSKKIQFFLPKSIAAGSHILTITAVDDRGNTHSINREIQIPIQSE